MLLASKASHGSVCRGGDKRQSSWGAVVGTMCTAAHSQSSEGGVESPAMHLPMRSLGGPLPTRDGDVQGTERLGCGSEPCPTPQG